jgi:integrase
MNKTRPELVTMQLAIAAGHPPTPASDGEFYWHPKMRLGLRLYNSGNAIWIVKYRNARGLERSHKIGNAAVLNLTFAEDAAKKVLGKVALGEDPAGDRQKQRARPRLTVRAMCFRYIDEMSRSKAMSPGTVYSYRGYARNQLGALANLQADELSRADISNRMREIIDEPPGKRGKPGGGPNVAHHLRSMLGTVYKMAMKDGLIDENPVEGTRRPEVAIKTPGQALTIDELGAIWRACETMAETSAARFKGNVRGGEKPTPANSIRADTVLMTRAEAARQSGLSKQIIWDAIKTGKIKTVWRRDMPDEHPIKIRQGYHRRTYLITAAEMRRFTEQRHGQMRSPHFEYSVIIRLLILTGARYSEMGGLRWSEILDLHAGVIHIKTFARDGRRRLKSRGGKPKDLELYLPQLAVDILKTVEKRPGCDTLFGNVERRSAAPRAKRHRLESVEQRAQEAVPLLGRSGLIQNAGFKKELDQTIAASGDTVRPWRIHWLRHSFSTRLDEDMGVDLRIIRAITNHLSQKQRDRMWGGEDEPGMHRRYTHSKYPVQQRRVLTAWAQRIRNAADRVEVPAANVSQFQLKEQTS